MVCLDGQVNKNLERASELARSAVQKGARLVLFPEFMSQGYRLTEELWDAGEPFDGPTKDWLCHTARRHAIYIGSSFLEARDDHFLNTFVLADPSGRVAGVVRKRRAARRGDGGRGNCDARLDPQETRNRAQAQPLHLPRLGGTRGHSPDRMAGPHRIHPFTNASFQSPRSRSARRSPECHPGK